MSPSGRGRQGAAARAVRCAAAAALLCLLGAAAFAQDNPLFGGVLGINSLHGAFELQGLYQSEDTRDKQVSSRTLTLGSSLTELMSLDMNGYLFSNRFLTFDGLVGLNLQQGQEEVETPLENQSAGVTELAPQYAISGLLLGQGLLSLGFAFNKSTSYASVPFEPLMKTDDENQQLTLSIKSTLIPTQLMFSHDNSSQTEFGYGENRSEDTTIAGINMTNRTDMSSTSFSYRYMDNYEKLEDVSTVTTQSTAQRHVQDGQINNIARFGDKGWATLTTRGSYRDETGTFPSSLFAWGESLLLRHTPNLSSQYVLDYSRSVVGGEESDLTSFEAGVTHQLYASLTSNARVYGSYQTLTGASDETYGFALSEDYRKMVPAGTLMVNLGGGYQVTDERTQPGVVSVLKESQTLSDTTTTFLDNQNVLLGSVTVTDATGLITYLRNVDYVLVQHGSLTEIRRVFTGAIPNGASVLVSYEFQTNLPIEYGTRDLHGRIQLDLFKHLSLYAYRLSLPEKLISGTNNGQLLSLEETLLGASIRWDPATLTAEHEIYDSTLAPYVSDRVSLNVDWPISETERVGGDATYRVVNFQQSGQGSETLRNVGLTYQITPLKWPRVSASAGYEWDTSQGYASQYAYGRVRFDYQMRDTIFSLDVELNQQNDIAERQLSQYVFFSVKRLLF